MPGWVSRFRKDVNSQIKYLQRVRLPKSISAKNSIFVGSGDSYACAHLVEYLSNHRILAYHPSDILHCPQALLDHEIYFISASGRTRSNIEAAQIARKLRVKTTAVTASYKSPLEEVCNKTLNLASLCSHQSSNTGVLEFTATVIYCMALIGISINLNIAGKIFKNACEQVNSCGQSLPTKFQSILFIGNDVLYPLANYGALKMHELFGFRSFGYLLDDYYHAPIFSLKKPDCVFVLDSEKRKNSISANFHSKLKKTHALSYHFQPQVGQSPFEKILFSIFIVQILCLTLAEKLEIDKPYYLSKKRILKLSSSLIY